MSTIKKKDMPMITIGIDGSTTFTGYAIFRDKTRVQSGVINGVGKSTYHRIKYICDILLALCKEYNVNNIAIEDIQFQTGKYKSFKALAAFQGVLLTTLISNLFTNDKNLFLYKSSEWRKVHKITQGRGKTRELSKQSALKVLSQTYGMDTSKIDIDEAEAILIAMAHIHLHTKK